jgi:DUF4097 and DUF4098 domain-containing protein YvlB
MQRDRRLATWTGTVLGILAALAFAAAQAKALDNSGDVTEEFHHTYALSPGGRVALDNINGSVHISSWDRKEVKVDAMKRAVDKEMLDDAKIEVDASSGSVSIRTRYVNGNREHDFYGWRQPASVEYTLTVPRNARLDEIKLINGALDLSDLTGEVRASCINGALNAKNLTGHMKLANINGRTEVALVPLSSSPVELTSVNGEIELTVPSDSKADIDATTVQGGIDNDLGLHVNNHRWVGHDLQGELGGGGTSIHLTNVNGRIEIRHAKDGKALSPVKDMKGEKDDSEI